MEWYKFDIAAYRQATQGLSIREHGVYRRLLDLYYTIEGPIFNDLRYIKQELRCSDRWDHQALINVLSTYFILDPSTNHYHNKKADKELIEYIERRDKNRANANTRWKHANGNANGNASAMPIQTDIHTKKQAAHFCQQYVDNGNKCGEPTTLRLGSQWLCRPHHPYLKDPT